MDGLRENDFLADAAVVFIPERNTGYEAGRMWDVIKQYPNTFALYQDKAPSSKRKDTPQESPGIYLGTQNTAPPGNVKVPFPTSICNADFWHKSQYAVYTRNYLEENRVMFMAMGVAGNPYKDDADVEFRKLREEVITQLKRCRRVVPPETIDNKFPRVTWSGKSNGSGNIQGGLNDDLAVAFCTCVYWADRIMQLNYPGVDYVGLGLK